MFDFLSKSKRIISKALNSRSTTIIEINFAELSTWPFFSSSKRSPRSFIPAEDITTLSSIFEGKDDYVGKCRISCRRTIPDARSTIVSRLRVGEVEIRARWSTLSDALVLL